MRFDKRPATCYKRSMKDTFTQFVRLGLLMLALGMTLLWVDSTWFAPRRIYCNQEALAAAGKAHHICWRELMKQYPADKIIWLDARDDAEYEKNRLTGINVYRIRKGSTDDPLSLNIEERLNQAAEKGECIVVFCSSAECDKAETAANNMREQFAFEAPVYVLYGGWETIKYESPEMLLVR